MMAPSEDDDVQVKYLPNYLNNSEQGLLGSYWAHIFRGST